MFVATMVIVVLLGCSMCRATFASSPRTKRSTNPQIPLVTDSFLIQVCCRAESAVGSARSCRVQTFVLAANYFKHEAESSSELVVSWLRVQPMHGLVMPSETLNVSRAQCKVDCAEC